MVVTILSVIAAIMIPRLRVINKDRNIREAARIVGSTFANASQRAVNEGRAGVLLERHPNFVDAAGVNFACTTMYTMRSLPPYTGDDTSSVAMFVSANSVTIPRPLEQDDMEIIRVNDYIRLNNSSVRYRILAFTPGPTMTLTLDRAGFLPPPPPGNYPFVIYRQPRKLESSRVELPDGYMIDLRFSGPVTVDGSIFNQTVPSADELQVAVTFDDAGAIDWLYYFDNTGTAQNIRPTGSLYWFVTEYEIDSTNSPIDSPSAMWVTNNNITGGVNVGYTAPPSGLIDMDGDGDTDTADKILEARSIAAQQQSAAQ